MRFTFTTLDHFISFQAVVTNVTADYDRWALLKANEPLITQLQAHWKGALIRRAFSSRLDYLRAHEQQAVTLQAQWKGFQQRKSYQERLEFLKNQMAIALKVCPLPSLVLYPILETEKEESIISLLWLVSLLFKEFLLSNVL